MGLSMVQIPPGIKTSTNIGSPRQAMDYAQKERLTGRMEFKFNLKNVHLFWLNGKPVGAIMLPKFGVDASYGRDVVDGMPQLIKTVQKIDIFTLDEETLEKLMEKHPDSTLADKVIDVDDIAKFLGSTDDKTLKLLKMILFSEEEASIDLFRNAYTMPPLADYTKEEFEEAFSNLLKGRVISTDGIKVQIPKYIRLIMKNEIISGIIQKGELRDILKEDDPFIKEFFDLLKKSDGRVPYTLFRDKYKGSREKYRLFETGDMLLEKDTLIEGIDRNGNTLYILPTEILQNLEKIKQDRVDVEVSKEELKKQLLEKFKIREPDRDQIKNIVNKFYEA